MLADRKAPSRSNGYPCSVATLLQQLPAEEAEALNDMLADRDWSSEAIWRAVVEEGHHAGRETVGRHRRGHCRCGTPTIGDKP